MLKCKDTRQHNILTIKGKDATNPRDIANTFNKLFINIRPSLSKTTPSFAENRSQNSFAVKPTTPYKIQKLISHLRNSKALCPISIPVTIFKNNLDILSRSLSLVIN